MNSPSPRDRLRKEVERAVAGLDQARAAAAARSGPPSPGDLYVLPILTEIAVEWLIVRERPDGPDRLLAVPADECRLIGPSDVRAREDVTRRRLAVRCGHGVWAPPELFR